MVVGFSANNAGEQEVTGLDRAVKNGDLDSALALEGVSGVSASNVAGQVVTKSGAASPGISGQATSGTAGAAGAGQAGTGLSVGMIAAVACVGVLLVVLVVAVVLVAVRTRNNKKQRIMSLNASHSVVPTAKASPKREAW